MDGAAKPHQASIAARDADPTETTISDVTVASAALGDTQNSYRATL